MPNYQLRDAIAKYDAFKRYCEEQESERKRIEDERATKRRAKKERRKRKAEAERRKWEDELAKLEREKQLARERELELEREMEKERQREREREREREQISSTSNGGKGKEREGSPRDGGLGRSDSGSASSEETRMRRNTDAPTSPPSAYRPRSATTVPYNGSTDDSLARRLAARSDVLKRSLDEEDTTRGNRVRGNEWDAHIKALEWSKELEELKATTSSSEQVNKKDPRRGKTLLHEQCSRESGANPEIIKYILVLDGDPNARDNYDWTPLHCLCQTCPSSAAMEALST